jgi:hypothetical protein
MRQYKAKVYPSNRRDIHTLSPRVLLKQIEGFEREYIWCNDKKLLKIIDKNNLKKPFTIEFDAKVYEYITSKREQKKALKDLKYITIL